MPTLNELNALVKKEKARKELLADMSRYEQEKQAKRKELFQLRHEKLGGMGQQARSGFVSGASRVKAGIASGFHRLRVAKTKSEKTDYKARERDLWGFGGDDGAGFGDSGDFGFDFDFNTKGKRRRGGFKWDF